MPIVDVQIVGPSLATAEVLAGAIGDALKMPPGRVWLRLHPMAEDRYAENGGVLQGPLPVFVSVLHARLPVGEALQAELAALTQAVASATGRPVARVHVEYAPAGAGRMAFGGRLVE